MHDPIADMLTRIRNAYMSRLTSTSVPYSKVKVELAKLLQTRGMVGEVSVDDATHLITIALKYDQGEPSIIHLKRVSRPGLRVYDQAKNFRKVRSGLGMMVISTSKGLMSGEQARKSKLGGEVIAEVW